VGIGGLGIGDWGLAQSPFPNPQSPIPNPQISNDLFLFLLFLTNYFFKLNF